MSELSEWESNQYAILRALVYAYLIGVIMGYMIGAKI